MARNCQLVRLSPYFVTAGFVEGVGVGAGVDGAGETRFNDEGVAVEERAVLAVPPHDRVKSSPGTEDSPAVVGNMLT